MIDSRSVSTYNPSKVSSTKLLTENGGMMDGNFSLKTHQNNKDLHIHLQGTFDGSSAFELIQTLKRRNSHNNFVFIDTSHLTETLPFGKTILDTHLPKNKSRIRLHFTGSHARSIIPRGCTLLKGSSNKKRSCGGTCRNCKCKSNHIRS